MACDRKELTEGAAGGCFKFDLKGRAHAFLQSDLPGDTLAVDFEQRELLETYPEFFKFISSTYATDEVIAAAVGDVNSFRQRSNMAEGVYRNHLWDKDILCGTAYSDRRWKSLFVEGLRPTTYVQASNYLATPRKWTNYR